MVASLGALPFSFDFAWIGGINASGNYLPFLKKFLDTQKNLVLKRMDISSSKPVCREKGALSTKGFNICTCTDLYAIVDSTLTPSTPPSLFANTEALSP